MALITWTDQQNMYQELTGLGDSVTLGKGKRDMMIGANKFMVNLNREYNRHTRFTDLCAGQQYYQIPENAFMIKEIIVSTGSWFPPMEQIPDEFAWRMMNMLAITGIPTHYFVRGRNEFGLYPTPAFNVSSGIELVFAPHATTLTQNDYTTGTVSVNNGSNIVNIATGSATVFTQQMSSLSLWFSVTDGTDNNDYQIKDFISNSQITLETNYQGLTNASATFRIGEVMDLPQAYLEAPVDYALMRFYLKRGVIGNMQVQEYQGLWNGAVQEAKDVYGQASESQVISAEPRFRIYNPWRGDPPSSISA